MAAIEVVSCVREYPDDNGPYLTLNVRNHWQSSRKVVLEVCVGGEEKLRMTVVADHLYKAVENAVNAH